VLCIYPRRRDSRIETLNEQAATKEGRAPVQVKVFGVHMEKSELLTIRTKFQDELDHLLSMEAQGIELTGQVADLFDQAQVDSDNQLFLKLSSRRRHYIFKIKEALQRMSEGTYGHCTDCGGEITFTRLLARPTATICIKCKEEEESEERHIPYARRSHTLGRSLVMSA